MAFVIIGTLLVLMKWLDFGPAANWSWFWILLPFGAAFVWWQFADLSGLSRKRAMDKLDERKEERRINNMKALGLDWRKASRGVRVFKDNSKREAERVEDERKAKRLADAAGKSSEELLKPKAGAAVEQDTRLD